MSVIHKLKRAVRGEVRPGTVALEVMRLGRASLAQQRERATLERVGTQPPRLRVEFARMNSNELLAHFRNRAKPEFFPGISASQISLASLQRSAFPLQTAHLVSSAEGMIANHSWPILGFGEKDFGAQPDWHRDPVSGATWPLKYHRDTQLIRGDGSDVRVLWELNRLGHLITLSRAYVMTGDERFSSEVFRQLESWSSQNPYGRGANWSCAMEVALRAMNLLGILQLLRHSQQMNEQRLSVLLTMLDQHGRYIHQNLEFSYLATSNHYLSDVVGLFWLGLMLPEFENAEKWRRFGLREMLREMDKQILPDGADFECSTGYHRFVLELLLYSFILCRANASDNREEILRSFMRCSLTCVHTCGRMGWPR